MRDGLMRAASVALWMALVPAGLSAGQSAADKGAAKPMIDQFGLGRTWVELEGETYGAKPDERGPIGGGQGYTKLVTKGDHHPATLDQLVAVLRKAKAGETVFLDGKAELDCSTRVYAEGLVIEIPEGVTLASDRGHKGSKGAIIYSDVFKTRPLIRAAGPNVRITGLRIRGPDPKRRLDHHRRSFGRGGGGSTYYYKFPTADGLATEHPGLEVDNCELSGWSHAAVYLKAGDNHHVHHNYIHHNQRQGLGYGVCHNTAFSLIEMNVFNFNRHSIAGTGRPGSGYEARHNVEVGASLSHCFDMHGGRDRKDGTKIAGTWLKVHHNTFRPPQTALKIRGLPEETADVHHNWFSHRTPSGAVSSPGRTRIRDNLYGLEKPKPTTPRSGR